MVHSGHHMLLRLLSLHLCNEHPSTPPPQKNIPSSSPPLEPLVTQLHPPGVLCWGIMTELRRVLPCSTKAPDPVLMITINSADACKLYEESYMVSDLKAGFPGQVLVPNGKKTTVVYICNTSLIINRKVRSALCGTAADSPASCLTAKSKLSRQQASLQKASTSTANPERRILQCLCTSCMRACRLVSL